MFACKYTTVSKSWVAICIGIYGVIWGIGLIYETSNPVLPSAMSIKVLMAPSIIAIFLNGNENLIRIWGSVIFGKDIVGNLNLFIKTILDHTLLSI